MALTGRVIWFVTRASRSRGYCRHRVANASFGRTRTARERTCATTLYSHSSEIQEASEEEVDGEKVAGEKIGSEEVSQSCGEEAGEEKLHGRHGSQQDEHVAGVGHLPTAGRVLRYCGFRVHKS